MKSVAVVALAIVVPELAKGQQLLSFVSKDVHVAAQLNEFSEVVKLVNLQTIIVQADLVPVIMTPDSPLKVEFSYIGFEGGTAQGELNGTVIDVENMSIEFVNFSLFPVTSPKLAELDDIVGKACGSDIAYQKNQAIDHACVNEGGMRFSGSANVSGSEISCVEGGVEFVTGQTAKFDEGTVCNVNGERWNLVDGRWIQF